MVLGVVVEFYNVSDRSNRGVRSELEPSIADSDCVSASIGKGKESETRGECYAAD